MIEDEETQRTIAINLREAAKKLRQQADDAEKAAEEIETKLRSESKKNPHSVKLTNAVDQILDQIDVVCFDCDGVIWHGDYLIPGVQKVLKRLEDLKKKILFCDQQRNNIQKKQCEKI